MLTLFIATDDKVRTFWNFANHTKQHLGKETNHLLVQQVKEICGQAPQHWSTSSIGHLILDMFGNVFRHLPCSSNYPAIRGTFQAHAFVDTCPMPWSSYCPAVSPDGVKEVFVVSSVTFALWKTRKKRNMAGSFMFCCFVLVGCCIIIIKHHRLQCQWRKTSSWRFVTLVTMTFFRFWRSAVHPKNGRQKEPIIYIYKTVATCCNRFRNTFGVGSFCTPRTLITPYGTNYTLNACQIEAALNKFKGANPSSKKMPAVESRK